MGKSYTGTISSKILHIKPFFLFISSNINDPVLYITYVARYVGGTENFLQKFNPFGSHFFEKMFPTV